MTRPEPEKAPKPYQQDTRHEWLVHVGFVQPGMPYRVVETWLPVSMLSDFTPTRAIPRGDEDDLEQDFRLREEGHTLTGYGYRA